MWLMALDTVTGRPRSPTMVTAVAATLLLDLVDQDVVAWHGDVVTSTEKHTPGATNTVLEFGRVRLLHAAGTGNLRPSDAINALYEDVWSTVGEDLAASGITVRRAHRLPRRTPRWDLPDPKTRIRVVQGLRHALRSSETLDPSAHRLAAVLWATNTEKHGLSENSLYNDNAEASLVPIMSRDPLAEDLTRAVAYLMGPTATMGGNPTFY